MKRHGRIYYVRDGTLSKKKKKKMDGTIFLWLHSTYIANLQQRKREKGNLVGQWVFIILLSVHCLEKHIFSFTSKENV